MIAEHIRAIIIATPGLASGTKVYPVRAPKGTIAPYIVFSTIGTEKRADMDGPLPLIRETIQVSVFASSYSVARDEIIRIVGTLNGFHDGLVANSDLVSKRETYEHDSDLFHLSADFDLDYDLLNVLFDSLTEKFDSTPGHFDTPGSPLS